MSLPLVYFASLALINAGSYLGYIDMPRRNQMMKDISALTQHCDNTVVLRRRDDRYRGVTFTCKNHLLQAVLEISGNPLQTVVYIDNKPLTEPLCTPKPFETYANYCKRVMEQYSLFSDTMSEKILAREQHKAQENVRKTKSKKKPVAIDVEELVTKLEKLKQARADRAKNNLDCATGEIINEQKETNMSS
jgi:hypothetical protein